MPSLRNSIKPAVPCWRNKATENEPTPNTYTWNQWGRQTVLPNIAPILQCASWLHNPQNKAFNINKTVNRFFNIIYIIVILNHKSRKRLTSYHFVLRTFICGPFLRDALGSYVSSSSSESCPLLFSLISNYVN